MRRPGVQAATALVTDGGASLGLVAGPAQPEDLTPTQSGSQLPCGRNVAIQPAPTSGARWKGGTPTPEREVDLRSTTSGRNSHVARQHSRPLAHVSHVPRVRSASASAPNAPDSATTTRSGTIHASINSIVVTVAICARWRGLRARSAARRGQRHRSVKRSTFVSSRLNVQVPGHWATAMPKSPRAGR